MRTMLGAATSALPCELHHAHSPDPTYTEIHHIIPQAWQAHWEPEGDWPYKGPSPDRTINGHAAILWDARTAVICRTGHGNVHYWLVAAMHEIDALVQSRHLDAVTPELVQTAWKSIARTARAAHRSQTKAELATAHLAIDRYMAAGGLLEGLIAARLWGQI